MGETAIWPKFVEQKRALTIGASLIETGAYGGKPNITYGTKMLPRALFKRSEIEQVAKMVTRKRDSKWLGKRAKRYVR